MTETTPMGNVIPIDDERIKDHLDRMVRGSVEDTLNALLDAEADQLCNACNGTSAARLVAIPGPVITNASFTPRLARFGCGYRSCASRP